VIAMAFVTVEQWIEIVRKKGIKKDSFYVYLFQRNTVTKKAMQLRLFGKFNKENAIARAKVKAKEHGNIPIEFVNW
jgi:hypothetical protein